jgi:hypothetical protein
MMIMEWKEQLEALEKAKDWDFAIAFMENVITQNRNDMDAYIFLNFRLMYLLVESYPYPEKSKVDYYEALAKKYFKESYAKFSNNPEYLYYTGQTAVMSEWFFGLTTEERERIISKAEAEYPEYPPIKFIYYWSVFRKDQKNKEALEYAGLTLSQDSPVKKVFETKGAIGEYLWGIYTYLAKQMLGIEKYYPRS